MQRIATAAGLIFALCGALLFISSDASAHGPTRQKVTESIAIAAPPDAVWKHIRNFSALHTWHPAVASSTTTDGNNIESRRTLQLDGGGTIIERLTKYSDEMRRYSYRMVDAGPVPVSNYSSTLSVAADEGTGSVVTWRGAFYRGEPRNDPPPEKNDEAAIAAVTGIYKAGLGSLKRQIEGK